MLKFIGLGTITTAISPAVLLQACKDAADAPGIGFSSLTKKQAATVKAIQDLIIPKTDTPSASEVGSVQFLDTFITHAYKPEDREQMQRQLDLFAAKLKEEHSVEVADADDKHLAPMMEKYFVNYIAPIKAENIEMEIEGNTIDTEGGESGKPVKKDDAFELNSLLTGIRWATLESYFQSEKVATEVLNYLPVPGPYIGQMPIEDLPNGMNWSL